MSADDDLHNDGLGTDDQYDELAICGLIYLGPERDIACEVRRGMDILASDGWKVGKVAAVIINRDDRQVTYLLLGTLNQILAYRRVSIDLIEQVVEGSIRLRIVGEVVNQLRTWHGS